MTQSLPSRPLRKYLRRTEAVEFSQVELSVTINNPARRRLHDIDDEGDCMVERRRLYKPYIKSPVFVLPHQICLFEQLYVV
jgi:hypothetical protein